MLTEGSYISSDKKHKSSMRDLSLSPVGKDRYAVKGATKTGKKHE